MSRGSLRHLPLRLILSPPILNPTYHNHHTLLARNLQIGTTDGALGLHAYRRWPCVSYLRLSVGPQCPFEPRSTAPKRNCGREGTGDLGRNGSSPAQAIPRRREKSASIWRVSRHPLRSGLRTNSACPQLQKWSSWGLDLGSAHVGSAPVRATVFSHRWLDPRRCATLTTV